MFFSIRNRFRMQHQVEVIQFYSLESSELHDPQRLVRLFTFFYEILLQKNIAGMIANCKDYSDDMTGQGLIYSR
jgi:hypothetical protein